MLNYFVSFVFFVDQLLFLGLTASTPAVSSRSGLVRTGISVCGGRGVAGRSRLIDAGISGASGTSSVTVCTRLIDASIPGGTTGTRTAATIAGCAGLVRATITREQRVRRHGDQCAEDEGD